jgi:hypothetical protein
MLRDGTIDVSPTSGSAQDASGGSVDIPHPDQPVD